MMTKKHFEETAKILRENWESAAGSAGDAEIYRRTGRLASQFAVWFATENPHFDRARFMKAAGF